MNRSRWTHVAARAARPLVAAVIVAGLALAVAAIIAEGAVQPMPYCYTDPVTGRIICVPSREQPARLDGGLAQPAAGQALALAAPGLVGAAPLPGHRQPPPPSAPPRLTVHDLRAFEGFGGQRPFVFTVTLSHVAGAEVDVAYRTIGASAVAGQDYLETSGRLIIPAGAGQGTISVPVLGDTAAEPLEQFALVLSDARGAVILDGVAEGLIDDGDAD
jgi:hypothetical protein